MRHLTTKELEAGLTEIAASPSDDGIVELIVRRPAVDEREVIDDGELDPDEGLVGDSWRARAGRSRRPPATGTQITLMNARLAALVAGDRSRWALAGDQLYVDLDLSSNNLPPGTRLEVGSAMLEVDAQPHTGCAKFVERFGLDAMKFVNAPTGRAMNLRGIYAKVVSPGRVRRGARIRKVYILAVLAVAAACAPASDQTADPAVPPDAPPVGLSNRVAFQAPASVAGRLRLDDGRLTFAPCSDAGVGVAVRDHPDGSGAALAREFGAGTGAGVMAMVRIEDGAIAEVRYAGPEGPDCSRLPPIGDVEARGNEPFWTVRVTGSTAIVYRPDAMDGVTYAGGAWSRPADGQWRFEASRENDDALVLELTEAVCRDNMSGARYPFTARLTRGGRTARGCALEGRG